MIKVARSKCCDESIKGHSKKHVCIKCNKPCDIYYIEYDPLEQ